MTSFCRIWIPTYGLLANLPYEALKGPEDLPLEWTAEMETAFRQRKEALVTAPALGLPDLAKPFSLFSHERKEIAQYLGPSQYPVSHLSKSSDITSQEWPPWDGSPNRCHTVNRGSFQTHFGTAPYSLLLIRFCCCCC